jgi:tetratricopeptide (TPR) repeat protein
VTRVFICYSHTPGDSEFAKWLFKQLSGVDLRLDPKMDMHTLGIGGYWSEAIPIIIRTCEMLLFVRSRFAIDARICKREIDVALVEGLEIANLRIDSDVTEFERTWGHMSVDFSSGREAGLRALKDKIRQRRTPEGRLLSMTYRLDHHRDRLRHPEGPDREHHQREADRLEREITELTRSLKRTTGHDAVPVQLTPNRRAPESHESSAANLIERTDARAVRAALREMEPGVLIVSGPAGVGKTTMVRTELERLLRDEADTSDQIFVHYHLGRVGSALGTTILTGDDRPKRRRADAAGSIRQAIDKAITDTNGVRAIIVIDAADHLQDPVSHRLIDLDLEDVFERLYDRRNRHRIKVLLICREPPQASPDKSWLLLARHVRLDRGLTLEQFAEFLRHLDRDNDLGIRTTSDHTITTTHRVTRGLPRLAELIHLSGARGYAPLSEVARALSRVPVAQVPMVVFNHVIDSLDAPTSQVLAAVAAFGTPIDEAAIRELLPSTYGKRRVEGILQWLVRRHVVDTAAGLFYVREPDRELVLQAQEGWIDLLKGAARVLAGRAPDNPSRLEDLDARLGEIAILLTAGLHIQAFTRMEDLEPRLARFNRRDLLLSQRLRIHGHLSRRNEAINTNALGLIYLDKRRLRDARFAFEQAVMLSKDERSNRLQATGNLAHTLFRLHETATAERHFETLRAEASDPFDPEALMLALRGLADCCERRGAYERAFELLDQAAALSEPGPIETLRQSLKRARSLMELNRDAEAYELIQQAAQEPQIRADHLVALATYQIDHDEHATGIRTSTEAAVLALRDGDRDLRRQAQTALAVAHLANRDYKEASAAISSPAKTRDTHVELSTLAVQGVSRFTLDSTAARSDFVQLLDEARARLQLDPQDFVMFDFVGLAQCGLHLSRGDSLDRARSAFEKAGELGRPPGLPRRLIRLLRALQEQAGSTVLDPIISSLEGFTADRSGPSSAPE